MPKNPPKVIRARFFRPGEILQLVFDHAIVITGHDAGNWFIVIDNRRYNVASKNPVKWNSIELNCFDVGPGPLSDRVVYAPPPANLEGDTGVPVESFDFRDIEDP